MAKSWVFLSAKYFRRGNWGNQDWYNYRSDFSDACFPPVRRVHSGDGINNPKAPEFAACISPPPNRNGRGMPAQGTAFSPSGGRTVPGEEFLFRKGGPTPEARRRRRAKNSSPPTYLARMAKISRYSAKASALSGNGYNHIPIGVAVPGFGPSGPHGIGSNRQRESATIPTPPLKLLRPSGISVPNVGRGKVHSARPIQSLLPSESQKSN